MVKDLNKNRKMVVCVTADKKRRVIRTADGKTRLLCKAANAQNKQ